MGKRIRQLASDRGCPTPRWAFVCATRYAANWRRILALNAWSALAGPLRSAKLAASTPAKRGG